MEKPRNNRDNYNYDVVNQYVKTSELCVQGSEEKPPTIGIRHLQTFLYFSLNFVAFGFRVCLSVAIVAMTDPSISTNPDVPTYPQWKAKNVILSAFFWGYIIPQVFAGYVARKYGAKRFLIPLMMVQSLLSYLIPYTAAHFGETGMIVSRALQGMSQGFIYPSSMHFLGRWAPPQERSRLGSIVFTAGKIGTVCGILATGFIASSWYGWPMAFHFFGTMGICWCVLMYIFGSDCPRQDPRISAVERDYIERSLGFTEEGAIHRTPWLKILTSPPVWAIVIAHSGYSYFFYTLLTQIPTYMNYVMNFDMKRNSFWSSMPYLTFWFMGFGFSSLSDCIINKGILSRGAARKLFTFFGFLIPACALVGLGFTRSDEPTKAVLLLIFAVSFTSAAFSGFVVNGVDLSPNHAGVIMGIVNGISQCAAVIAPLVVQVLVTDVRNPLEWRIVFCLAAAVSVIMALLYVLLGSGEVQTWNDEDGGDEKEAH